MGKQPVFLVQIQRFLSLFLVRFLIKVYLSWARNNHAGGTFSIAVIFVPGIVLPLSITIPPCQSNFTTRVTASFNVRVSLTKNMKVLFCTTILVISFSAVYCISAPNGTCGNTAYHYCDWAGWGTWSNCSNQCGTGTQEKKRFICCPPEYNASSILQCVQQLCAHSVSDYIKHQSCTSSAGCQGRGWQIQL